MQPSSKISFSLDELRLRSFDSAPEAEARGGTVRGHQCGCSACTGCSMCTNCSQCSACSACTACSGPTGCNCQNCSHLWSY